MGCRHARVLYMFLDEPPLMNMCCSEQRSVFSALPLLPRRRCMESRKFGDYWLHLLRAGVVAVRATLSCVKGKSARPQDHGRSTSFKASPTLFEIGRGHLANAMAQVSRRLFLSLRTSRGATAGLAGQMTCCQCHRRAVVAAHVADP